ncbi:MAG: ribbon-helix-helix protein, CopG family [Anaerolineae bacterium]
MRATTTMRRVMFTIPPSLLEQVEEAAAKLNTSRSGLIRQALEHFLEEQRRQELRELLKEGYLYRAEESLQLAEEFRIAEQEAWDKYAPWEEE